jgi:ABC-2 type transport system permease protein
MRAALFITAKDLRSRVRDRSAYIVAFIAPLALALIFTAIFESTASDRVSFEFGVVDQDQGDLGGVFVSQVLGGIEDEGMAAITPLPDVPAARTSLEEQDLEAVFVIPDDFTATVRSSRPASIQVLGHADAQLAVQAARSISQSFAASLERVQASVHALTHDSQATHDEAAALAQRLAAAPSPITTTTDAVADKELGSAARNSAGMAVMFLFFTVQFGVMGYLEERRDGTLSRLLAAPISHGTVLAGKALTSIVMGAVSMTVLLGAAALFMGADYGDPAGVALLVAAGVLSAVAITILVAAIARTAEQAGNWQAMIGVILAMFGGAFFPLSQSPDWMVALSRLTPHAWFLSGLGDLSAGGGVGDVLPAVGAMLAFAAVVLALSIVPLRRMVLR